MRRIFGNLYFLTFLNGFLISSLLYFKMESGYENELFSAIQVSVENKVSRADAQDSIVVNAMHACHTLMMNRQAVFGGEAVGGLKASYFHPTSIDLMTANGACGSYALVLARVLQNFHFPIRVAQMKANGVFAAHNIVEVRTNNGWAILDALFDVSFRKPGGGLASFHDVENDWTFYKKQLPAGYDMSYRYEDVRYSNWTKIPVIQPAIKKILDRVLGKQKADTISVRTFFLNPYELFYGVVLFFLVPLVSFTILRLIQTQVAAGRHSNLTLHSMIKYFRERFTARHLLNKNADHLSAS